MVEHCEELVGSDGLPACDVPITQVTICQPMDLDAIYMRTQLTSPLGFKEQTLERNIRVKALIF